MLHLRLLTFGFIVLGFIVCSPSSTAAQSFDYEERPRLNYRFVEADTDLALDTDEGSLSGSVEYTLEANIDGADTLSLQAVGLQVDSVQSGEEGGSLDFKQVDESLQIALTDSSVTGRKYRVRVHYHSTPRFGLLRSSEGTIWSSLLPRSHRHWMPSVDHPAVSFTSTLSLTLPEKYTVSATGVQTDKEATSNGMVRWTFRTGRAVPITAISFAAGLFNEEGVSFGIKRITSYAEPMAAGRNEQQQLVRQAEQMIRQLEEVTGMEYPYQRLHLVMLNDHHWEQKPYAASMVYLYSNRGDWVDQLRRGIYSQWFGVYQREVQWQQAWPIHLFQTAMHYTISDAPALLLTGAEPDHPGVSIYENFSVAEWNGWQQKPLWNRGGLEQTARRILPDLLEEGPGALTPGMYEDLWYRYSGQPSIEVPETKSSTPQPSGSVSDTLVYRVDYQLSPAGDALTLAFDAEQGELDQPLTLPVDIMTGSDDRRISIEISGDTDTASVSLPAGVRNVYINEPEGRAVILKEYKPVPYLLYQLRTADDTKARVKAATQIGYQADNPDLQLALGDVMSQPMEPKVEAALLRSYGAITEGATGTQARFIEALSSESARVRMVALEVLLNYPMDAQVTQRIRQVAENDSDARIARNALKSYMGRIDSSAALGYVNSVVQQDTAGVRAITAIAMLAENGNASAAVERARFYIEPIYSFRVRREAFNILLAHETSEEVWQERLPKLLGDSDPRMRYITIQNLERIPGVDASAVIETHRAREYDARVWQVISN